jgi:hypothetical protein
MDDEVEALHRNALAECAPHAGELEQGPRVHRGSLADPPLE